MGARLMLPDTCRAFGLAAAAAAGVRYRSSQSRTAHAHRGSRRHGDVRCFRSARRDIIGITRRRYHCHFDEPPMLFVRRFFIT